MKQILPYNNSVDADIIRKILDLNRQFYQTFSLQFSETRQRIQPGVRRIIERHLEGADGSILDLGCGNGELAREMAKRGIQGPYLGLDFSPGLLEEARRNLPESIQAEFYQLDLSQEDWNASTAGEALSRLKLFRFCLAFAVLHHLPGENLRRSVIKKARNYIEPGGLFIHSVWQFLNSPRLRARLQPWEKAGINPEQVERDDYLLDWRHGGEGLRYAHHFRQEKLEDLARVGGFRILETFESDGEGGNLGLYQVWEAA
jgi:tRNA (uracil-5-)-methyltransferase TRM9